jgi:hypothetical protein
MRRATISGLSDLSGLSGLSGLSLLPLLPLLASCALNADVAAPVAPTAGSTARTRLCVEPPRGPVHEYRHRRSRLYKSLGEPRFRGIDLIAMVDDPVQLLGGKLAYTAADKDVGDEDVHVFACFPDGWRAIGRARTDREGRFELGLAGAHRLPVGMRDLYAHVPGDGGGVRFLAYVAPRGAAAIVSDIDGTLTESEEAILNTVLFGDDVGYQPHAPAALAAAARGWPIIYVTARGDQYTEVTRRWLAVHGFPRGPLRLARSVMVPAGGKSVAFKTDVFRALRIPIAAGIGNRASDITSYTNAGLPPGRILINLPEFADEVAAALAAGKATGFDDYRELPALLARPAP